METKHMTMNNEMTTNNVPTPEFREPQVTKLVDQTEKTTQSETWCNQFTTEEIRVTGYGLDRTYKKGELIPVTEMQDGFTMLDPYRCHVFDGVFVGGKKVGKEFIPKKYIETKWFTRMRRVETFIFEIQ